MTTSNSQPGGYHPSSIGTGRVTRRGREWDTPAAKASGFRSAFLNDCDEKFARNNKYTVQVRNARVLHWVLTCVIMLLLSVQMYSHMVTVDPCVRAQMSLCLLESFSSSRTTTPAVVLSSASNTIPKIIHQQWRSSTVKNEEAMFTRDKWSDWHAAWHRLFPESEGYKHILWTDDMMLDFITEHYPWFLPVYNSYPANIQRVDASRYFILYHYGGVYADMDYEPLTNFYKHLPSDRVSLIESPYKFIEEAQNALMASPQGHPFWNTTFKVLTETTDKIDVLSSTGPRMLSLVMERTPQQYWYILPCENFQRIPDGKDNTSPWHVVIFQQFTHYVPQRSCGSWQKQGPGDCQFGRHHNTVTWMRKKGPFKFWFDRIF